MSIEQLIEKFRGEVTNFMATAIVDIKSGFAVVGGSSDPSFDATVASPTYAEVVKSNARALKLLGIDPRSTEDILITTTSAYLMIRLLGTNYYHGLAITREGNLGLARVIMKKYEPAFLNALRALGA